MAAAAALLPWLIGGCKSAPQYRQEADDAAYRIIQQAQTQALGRAEPFTISVPERRLREALLLEQALPYAAPDSLGSREVELIPQFPDASYSQQTGDPLPAAPWLDRAAQQGMTINLNEALMIGARNSRDYQAQKERVFVAALDLDFERDAFRNTWAGLMASEGIAELLGEDSAGVEHRAELTLTRQFKSGMLLTAKIGLDLVKLLTGSGASSLGAFGDASVSIPLLRGSGQFVTTEPLRQAQRDVVYAIYEFERFKQTFAVQIAAEYLSVLETLDRVKNAEQNYRSLIGSTRRARRMADAGRLPDIQVNQALQDELRARDRWVSAQQTYERAMDNFKVQLGLPADAAITLDPTELDRLAAAVPAPEAATATGEPAPPADAPIVLVPPNPADGGPMEIPQDRAMRLAFDHRLDLRVAIGRIDDAQRNVVVAADALRADLTLLGSMSIGERRTLSSAGRDDASLRFDEGSYSALVNLDLPLHRTSERNAYRESLIGFEESVRDLQATEDQIKLAVRDDLRNLMQAREQLRIQAQAVEVAKRRVDSTNLFLQAGRVEIRDVLEAQESLVAAENARTAAIVQYRVSELDLQRNLGVLEVSHDGLWREADLRETDDDEEL